MKTINKKIESIIIRMPNWLGDAVMAIPAILDLRSAYPNARLTLMCVHHVAVLFKNDPICDHIFSFYQDKDTRSINRRHVIAHLKHENYDLGVLFTHSWSSASLFWSAGIPCRLGYRNDVRQMLLTHSLKFSKDKDQCHLVDVYRHLLTPLNIPISKAKPRIKISEGEMLEAWSRVKQFDITPQHRIIGMSPSAAYGEAKCWMPDRFAEVARCLIEKDPNHIVLVFGEQSHYNLVSEICRGLGPRVKNLSGTTNLRELMGLIKLCNVLLTNDSGPMHIAHALEVPVVALFGSTSPVQTGPYQEPESVIYKHVACSPCFKKICPTDFVCMKSIHVHEVYDAVLKVLQNQCIGCS